MKSCFALCILVQLLILPFVPSALGQEVFVENRGQWHQQARFYAQLDGLDAWITNNGIAYDVHATDSTARKGHVIRMRFEGANGRATAASADRESGIHNYIKGNDSTKWVTHVPVFSKTRIDRLYNGVDALLQFQDHTLRYDLVVAPGADVAQIQMKFEGANSVSVNKSGDLEIATSIGIVRQKRLRAFQTTKNGKQRRVQCRFEVIDPLTVRFVVGTYDPRLELTIDPLVYSTYVGGASHCEMHALAVDRDGCAHAVGLVTDVNFPTTAGAYQTTATSAVNNMAIFKLAADGKTMIYSTFLLAALEGVNAGGTLNSMGLEIDADGNAVVSGSTSAADFPTTAGAVQRMLKGASDAFVTKFNATGSALLYSTLVGGDGNERATALALDRQGNVYLTGFTWQPTGLNTFPVTPGAYVTVPQNSNSTVADGFVVKLNNNLTALTYGTYLGGAGDDFSRSIAIDRSGNAYLIGRTCSQDFPTTVGAYQRTGHGVGTCTGFLLKLNAAGNGLIYSTFVRCATLGATELRSVCVDSSDRAVVGGYTDNNNYPTTTGALQVTKLGTSYNSFITKFNAAGSGLVYSTYLGGSLSERLSELSCDYAGNVYVVGVSFSSNYPTTADAYDRTGSTSTTDPEAFITVILPNGNAVLYSSFIGGSRFDLANAVALDNSGGVYVGGGTSSRDFPVTPSAYQAASGLPAQATTPSNMFVSKFSLCTVTLQQAPDTATCRGSSIPIGGLQAQAGVPPYRYVWEPAIGLSDDSVYNPTATPDTTTTYRLTMTDGMGCVLRDTVVVTVWKVTAEAGRDTTICAGQTITLGGPATGVNTPFTYQWTPTTGLSTPIAAITQARPFVNTRYIVKATDTKGCVALDTMDVKVNDSVIVDAGPDVSMCTGGSANLVASVIGGMAPYEYTWTPSLGLNRTDQATAVARPAATTKYFVHVVDAFGCASVDSVIVSVGSYTSSKIAAMPGLRLCAGDSTVLDAGAGYSNYRWSTGRTTRTIVVKSAGTYWATFQDATGCSGKTDTVQVSMSPLPDVRIRGAKTVCTNSTLSYSVSPTASATYAWSLTGTTGTIESRIDSSGVVIAWGGVGTASIAVRMTSASGCADSTMVVVTVGSGLKPFVTPSRSTVLCNGQTVELDAGAGYVDYLWNTGETSPKITVTQAGSYTVRVFDGTGCGGTSDTVVVTVGTGPSPVITSSRGDTICIDSATTLSLSSAYVGYLWSTGETTSSIEVRNPGTYTVTVTDADSCTGTATFTVQTHAAPFIEISPSGSVTICTGDSVVLAATTGHASYLWSTSETSPSITVAAAGSYSVVIEDGKGCRGLSDTVDVIVSPPTARPVITVSGDTLIATAADTYQWIRNDVYISGETSQRYVTTQAGRYTVRVSSVGTCPSVSLPTQVGDATSVAHAVWIDTISGRVGDRLRLTMHVEPAVAIGENAVGYDVYMHITPSALFPHACIDAAAAVSSNSTLQMTSMQYDATGAVGITRIAASPIVAGSTLLYLDVEGLVTASPLATVIIDSVVLRTGAINGAATKLDLAGDGLVILTGCAIERAFGTRARLLSVQPNPADDATVVRYRTSAGSQAMLRLVDMQGQLVRSIPLPADIDAATSIAGASTTTSEHSIVINIDQLATGVYVLQICDLHEVDALPLIITK